MASKDFLYDLVEPSVTMYTRHSLIVTSSYYIQFVGKWVECRSTKKKLIRIIEMRRYRCNLLCCRGQRDREETKRVKGETKESEDIVKEKERKRMLKPVEMTKFMQRRRRVVDKKGKKI